jgi:hypothetical protein
MAHRTVHPVSFAVRIAALLAWSLANGSAAGQGFPKEGKFDLMTCQSGTTTTMEVSANARASSNEFIGNTRSTPPGGFLDMTTYHCQSLGVTLNGKYSGSYICEGIDKDGDRYMSRGTTDGAKTTAEVLAGTGKYEGLTRTGSVESVGVFPTIKPGTFTGCSHQTGAYKMK